MFNFFIQILQSSKTGLWKQILDRKKKAGFACYYWMFVAYFYYLQNLETFHSAKFFCRSISFAQMRGCKRVLDDPLKNPCCGQKWVLATLIKTLRAAKNEYWWPFSLTFWPLFFSKWVLKTLTWPNLSTLALWDHTLRYHNACILV